MAVTVHLAVAVSELRPRKQPSIALSTFCRGGLRRGFGRARQHGHRAELRGRRGLRRGKRLAREPVRGFEIGNRREERKAEQHLGFLGTTERRLILIHREGAAESHHAAEDQADQHDPHLVRLLGLLGEVRRIDDAELLAFLTLLKVLGEISLHRFSVERAFVEQRLIVLLHVVVVAHENHELLLARRRPLDPPLVGLHLRRQPDAPLLEACEFDLRLIALPDQPLEIRIERLDGFLVHLAPRETVFVHQLRLDGFDLLLDLHDVRVGLLVPRFQGGQVPFQFAQVLDQRIASGRAQSGRRGPARFIISDRFVDEADAVRQTVDGFALHRNVRLQAIQRPQIRFHLLRQLAHVFFLEVADQLLLRLETRLGLRELLLEEFGRALDKLLPHSQVLFDKQRRQLGRDFHCHHGILMRE